jgi:hypothetical protein
MNIEPAYATFEQAKLLKEKGFNLFTAYIYPLETFVSYEENYAKEFKKGILYKYTFLDNNPIISAPEHWQVVEWLRVKHGIWITVFTNKSENWKTLWSFKLDWIYPEDTPDSEDIEPKYYKIPTHVKNEFDSPQEAYSTAFNYILKELI